MAINEVGKVDFAGSPLEGASFPGNEPQRKAWLSLTTEERRYLIAKLHE